MVILHFFRRYPWTISTFIVFLVLIWQGNTQDQFCSVSNKIDRTTTGTLAGTYKYLDALNTHELRQTLNRFILASLPRQEADARVRRMPGVCTVYGYEYPTIGQRPADVDRLYKLWTDQKVITRRVR